MPTIHPVVDEGLGNSAYVVELGDRRALVIDPARDPTPFLELARWRRLQIAYVAETHLHADFLTGSRELAAADGAHVLAPQASRLGFAHRGLEDGQEVDLGGLTLGVLATPGHAPEHASYLLLDGARPVAVFSGGALLVGAVARTDLTGPELTEPLARAAYRSLHGRLLSLPDELAVYPTHGAGSFCATPAGDQRTTTIGAERRHNRLLAAPDEDSFVAELLAGFGSYPPYFGRLRERNRVGPELLGPDWQVMPLLSTDQVQQHLAGGGLVVDARPITAFAAGHIPGALSIALRPAFVSWLGWLLEDTQPLVFVLDEDQDRGELARQCRTIGYDHLVGELAGGKAAWRATGLTEVRLPLVEAGQLDHRHGVVLDVRQASEVADGHLPGALTVELGALAGDRLPAQLPEGPVAVMCSHGQRAMTAASLLERAGRRDLQVVVGGVDDWQRATGQALAHPVTQPPPVRPGGLRLGLRANLAQFGLLVGVNALVGGMVGQERSLLSLLATEVFGLAAVSAALTYIVAFGLTKAATNLVAGTLADRYGRKPVLVAGWLVGLPVPLLLIWAPSWGWVVAANILLGVNQGLCWSTTVIMKIDLAGPQRRGLAMGLNEAAGYLAVAVTAYLTGLIAARAGLRPEPFYLGLAYAGLGLGLSALLVRETRGHAQLEAQLTDAARTTVGNPGPNRTLAAARPGWSTTSTTASPGGCCRCCLSAAASRSARLACWLRSIRPSGAWDSYLPAPCRTGSAASR